MTVIVSSPLDTDATVCDRNDSEVLPSPFDGWPVYDRIFDAIARVLHRRQAKHILLVGERGVGKSTLVAELKRRMTTGRILFLQNRPLHFVDCRFVPPEESYPQLRHILADASQQPDSLFCLNGFAALLRNDRGTSNKAVLLAALARSSFRLIGLITPREFEELVAGDAEMLDFFTRIDVSDPELPVAQKLLAHYAIGLQEKYQVQIEPEAIESAAVLSANYILNDQLPAKALKILTDLCEEVDYERTELGSPRTCVTVDDVVSAVAQTAGIPVETLRGIADKVDYEKNLSLEVVGQEHVVREVATELSLIKAGFTDRHKPASVMLFIGQTGTGKTEMAKVLARLYSTSKRLKTYTLGNFVEPHSVSGMIGVPAGYVGHDQGGRLINELNSDPYGVFLLDEVDKAHPDVLQPFLNLFDEGWVRDQRGTIAYADKSIFVLTTNVGQRMIADMVREGKSMQDIATRMKETLSQIRHTKSDRPVFAPEFLARIKRVIVFRPLDRDAMGGICRKLIAEMRGNWQARRGKQLEIEEALIESIAQRAHEINDRSGSKEGGRIVRKLLADLVEAKIQQAISERTEEYQRAALVHVQSTSEESSESPSVGVTFRNS